MMLRVLVYVYVCLCDSVCLCVCVTVCVTHAHTLASFLQTPPNIAGMIMHSDGKSISSCHFFTPREVEHEHSDVTRRHIPHQFWRKDRWQITVFLKLGTLSASSKQCWWKVHLLINTETQLAERGRFSQQDAPKWQLPDRKRICEMLS